MIINIKIAKSSDTDTQPITDRITACLNPLQQVEVLSETDSDSTEYSCVVGRDADINQVLTQLRDDDIISITLSKARPFIDSNEAFLSTLSTLTEMKNEDGAPTISSFEVLLTYPLGDRYSCVSEEFSDVVGKAFGLLPNHECTSFFDNGDVVVVIHADRCDIDSIQTFCEQVNEPYCTLTSGGDHPDAMPFNLDSNTGWSITANINSAKNHARNYTPPMYEPYDEFSNTSVALVMQGTQDALPSMNDLVEELNQASEASSPYSGSSMSTSVSNYNSSGEQWINLEVNIITSDPELVSYVEHEGVEHIIKAPPGSIKEASLTITRYVNLIKQAEAFKVAPPSVPCSPSTAIDQTTSDIPDVSTIAINGEPLSDVLIPATASNNDSRAVATQQSEFVAQKAAVLTNPDYEMTALNLAKPFDDFEYPEPATFGLLSATPPASINTIKSVVSRMGLDPSCASSFKGGEVKEVGIRFDNAPVTLDMHVLEMAIPMNVLLVPFNFTDLAMDGTDDLSKGFGITFPTPQAYDPDNASNFDNMYNSRFTVSGIPIDGSYGLPHDCTSPYCPVIQGLFGTDQHAMVDDELFLFDTKIPVQLTVSDLSNPDAIGEYTGISAYIVFYCSNTGAPMVLITNPSQEN